jgi:hypothetical protein
MIAQTSSYAPDSKYPNSNYYEECFEELLTDVERAWSESANDVIAQARMLACISDPDYLILMFDDLKEKKGIPFGLRTINKMVKNGDFPMPIRLEKQYGWLNHHIDEWIESRITDRDASGDDDE